MNASKSVNSSTSATTGITTAESTMSKFVDMSKMPAMPGMTGGKKTKKVVKKPVGKKPAAKKTTKKGGALMDDVKNLAVPFAILLAKQGLQSMFDKKKAKKGGEVELSASSASKVSSQRRRSTIAGGSCGSQCAGLSQFTNAATPVAPTATQPPALPTLPQMGGKKKVVKRVVKKIKKSKKGGSEEQEAGAHSMQVKSRFEKLSKEIDEFLQKY
jgi:hypothetical protein